MSSDVKHSLTIAGHRTSISLERPFWDHLTAIAATRDLSVAALVAQIDEAREARNLSSAIRLFVLSELEARIVHQHHDGAREG
jgi:predicted DNA-binding ribbon-helix-helix protein